MSNTAHPSTTVAQPGISKEEEKFTNMMYNKHICYSWYTYCKLNNKYIIGITFVDDYKNNNNKKIIKYTFVAYFYTMFL